MSRDIYNERAIEAIKEGNQELVIKVLDDAKKEGITAVDLLHNGFAKGMEELGKQFAEGEIFLPELILSSEAMKIVTGRVEAELSETGTKLGGKGVIVIGTVQDDVHDIGKSICASMLKSSGFIVHDLGKQVPLQEFIDKAMECDADIVASSALLTTTMEHQKSIEELLKLNNLKGKVRTMIGGSPVSQGWADQIGADGYANDAITCCQKAAELMGHKE